MSVIRQPIRNMQYTGISRIAVEALDDPDVIPLWFGESDLVTPDFICDAAKQAMDDGKTFYNYARGHRPLRDSLHRYHQRIYGIDLDPDRITVPGSTMLSVVLAAQALLTSGDEIILITPAWPNVGYAIDTIGASMKEVRLVENVDGWALDIDAIEKAVTPKTKAIYINTPSNPTGWIATSDEIKSLIDLARRHKFGIIADEVYHRNVYTGRDPAPSFLEYATGDDDLFVVNGFSKAWAMTGWRLGWMITPSGLDEQMAMLSECYNTGATSFTQYGGIAALEQGEAFVTSLIERCRQNRSTVMETFSNHPHLSLSEPEGAFYAFPKLRDPKALGFEDGYAFACAARDRAKVGLAPGYTFGIGNENHFRLCYAISPDRFKEAIGRLDSLISG